MAKKNNQAPREAGSPTQILKTLETSRGLVEIRRFRAHEFAELSQTAALAAKASPLEFGGIEALLMLILSYLSTVDGRQCTIEDLDEMLESEVNELMAAVSAAPTSIDTSNGITTGILPSGNHFEMETPKGKHLRRAGEMGEDQKPFHFVALTTRINGEPVGYHDVRMWDGLDFIAIKNVGGDIPN